MTSQPDHRWSSYFLRQGLEFQKFWSILCSDDTRFIVFILGQGFDPRMCEALKTIVEVRGKSKVECILVKYDEGPTSSSHRHKALVEQNLKDLQSILVQNEVTIPREVTIKMFSSENRRIGSKNAAQLFRSLGEFPNCTDIVVDVSAMPRGIYFPIILKLLRLIDEPKEQDQKNPNLHVVVSENYSLDKKIVDESLEESATYMPGFETIEREATKEFPKIWIPVMGEGQETQLRRIRDLTKPDEVCPIMPFPSKNTRRGDDLFLEYRKFLYDDLHIDTKNIIYADEQNPFQVYRQISKVALHYDKSLNIIGKCKIIISALSSKLLSIGALLAAYDLKQSKMMVAIAHVESDGFEIKDYDPNKDKDSQLFEMWLSGECYE
jgi:hypothetical protein